MDFYKIKKFFQRDKTESIVKSLKFLKIPKDKENFILVIKKTISKENAKKITAFTVMKALWTDNLGDLDVLFFPKQLQNQNEFLR